MLLWLRFGFVYFRFGWLKMSEFAEFVGRFAPSKPNVIADSTRARRYAGEHTLGRNKYFTLCNLPDGNDQETLLRELEAYYNPLQDCVVDLFDSTIPEHRKVLPEAAHIYEAFIALLLQPFAGRPHALTKRVIAEAFSPSIERA